MKMKTDKLVIGIVGPAGSGKSTLAKYVARQYKSVRLSFATPLKRAVEEIFGLLRGALDDQDVKASIEPITGMTYRELLVSFGTEGRKLNPELWVKLLLQQIKQNEWKVVVIDDVRHANEAQMVRDLGGFLVRLDLPGFGLKDVKDFECDLVFKERMVTAKCADLVKRFGDNWLRARGGWG
jgi:energy-coupling factor transporter ATP-binding protein EcfA2